MGGTIPSGHFGRGRTPQSSMILPHPPTGYQRTPFTPPPPFGSQPGDDFGPGGNVVDDLDGPAPGGPPVQTHVPGQLSFLSQNQVGSREGSPITQLGFSQQIEQYKRELAEQRALAEASRKQQEDILKQFQDQKAQVADATNNFYRNVLTPERQILFDQQIQRGVAPTDAYRYAAGYAAPVPGGGGGVGPGEGGPGPGEGGEGGPGGPGDSDGGPGPGDSSTGP